jgi:hypothetical protein
MHVPRTGAVRMPRFETLPVQHATPGLSRRALMGRAAGLAGVAVGANLLRPAGAFAAPKSNPAPKPTANTTNLNGTDFHVTFFGRGVDPSSIGDFNGFVGVAQVQGKGTATNPNGSTEQLLFDTDMRFMRGNYVAQDGRVHQGTFGFI